MSIRASKELKKRIKFLSTAPELVEKYRLSYIAGNQQALSNALYIVGHSGLPIPAWIVNGILGLGEPIAAQIKHGQHSSNTKWAADMAKHRVRWNAVLVAREDGYKGPDAYERAREMLKSEGDHIEISTLEKSFNKVHRVRNNPEKMAAFLPIREYWEPLEDY